MDDLIWYACYGSNLLRSRFMCYIEGGQPEGGAKIYRGCTNPTPPVNTKPIILPYELYFSQRSDIWENKGVAFIKSQRNENAKTLGRMYLITKQQFVEIVRVENNLHPREDYLTIDFEQVINNGESVLFPSWYGRIIYIGEDDGRPIFTFTAGWGDDEIEPNPPGEKYLEIIVKGIKETYDLPDDEIIHYLRNTIGIKT